MGTPRECSSVEKSSKRLSRLKVPERRRALVNPGERGIPVFPIWPRNLNFSKRQVLTRIPGGVAGVPGDFPGTPSQFG